MGLESDLPLGDYAPPRIPRCTRDRAGNLAAPAAGCPPGFSLTFGLLPLLDVLLHSRSISVDNLAFQSSSTTLPLL